MAKLPLQVIFGGALFGHGAGWNTPEQLQEVLQALEQHNIKQIDTAQIYPNSEELLGQTGAGKRFVIDTKFAGGFMPEPSTKEQVVQTAQESLKKLDMDQVNVYYLHAPDRTTPLEETLAGIDELYRAGKFKLFGLSNFRADEVQEVVRIAKEKGFVTPAVYQGNYNAFSRRAETELLPVLREHNIRFYAYSPIAGGFLTKTKEQLLSGGEGRWNPNDGLGGFYNEVYGHTRLRDSLDEWGSIADSVGVSRAELAYRWIFYHSALQKESDDAVLIGASRISQLEQTLAAIEHGPLDADAVKRIDGIWEKIKDIAVLDNLNRS